MKSNHRARCFLLVISSLVWPTPKSKAVFSQKQEEMSAEGSAERSVCYALVVEHVLGVKGGGFGLISTTTNGQYVVCGGGCWILGRRCDWGRGEVAPEKQGSGGGQ